MAVSVVQPLGCNLQQGCVFLVCFYATIPPFHLPGKAETVKLSLSSFRKVPASCFSQNRFHRLPLNFPQNGETPRNGKKFKKSIDNNVGS